MNRLLLFLALLLLLATDSRAQVPLPTSPPLSQDYVRSRRLGLTFISSYDHPASEERYRNALVLGAGWNRWPLYWDRVEISPGVFDWSAYDRLVADDIQHSLGINAILIGRPSFYADGGSISGLNTPIFNDGGDLPAPGATINPANHWANFVFQAATRYSPGGLLAQQFGWSSGVTIWEAWNEPDLPLFWSGSVEDYARLLKITYIVTHYASDNSFVMFGGLAYGDPDTDNYLARVLDVFAQDPLREQFGWFMDVVAVHNYAYALRSGLVVQRVRQTLGNYGFDRAIWLNESGVPVWDDYPGPTWTRANPEMRQLRATVTQQAAFVVQSSAYAWLYGADAVFIHQLYDDCGNQPGGTDFAPNNGDLCVDGRACWGDAYGLYRNTRSNDCFRQHPLPGTPRPSASAYRLLAQIFGTQPFANGRELDFGGSMVVLQFERPQSRERILVFWNRTLEPQNIVIPAAGSSATLHSTDITGAYSSITLLPNTENTYALSMPPATRDDYPFLPEGEVSAIGGPPLLLVERVNDATPTPQAAPTLTLLPGPAPTTDPSLDTTPPTASVLPLPEVSPPTFDVAWSGSDNSGIDRYLIWVRVDGGDWQPWLETNRTSAQYSGVSGSLYEFAAWAVDLAGNWSSYSDLAPQALTRVQ
ncbi:MAG: hypothetical protein HXY40_00955 [Chloroflexi bacterium]|nr:hypothetical protein [Chloroflexota bacterium]